MLNIKPIVEYVDDYENSRFDVYTCCGASGPDPDFTAIYFTRRRCHPRDPTALAMSAQKPTAAATRPGDRRPRGASRRVPPLCEVLTHDLPWAALWHENRVLALAEGVGGDFTELGMSWLPGTIPGSWQWTKNGAG